MHGLHLPGNQNHGYWNSHLTIFSNSFLLQSDKIKYFVFLLPCEKHLFTAPLIAVLWQMKAKSRRSHHLSDYYKTVQLTPTHSPTGLGQLAHWRWRQQPAHWVFCAVVGGEAPQTLWRRNTKISCLHARLLLRSKQSTNCSFHESTASSLMTEKIINLKMWMLALGNVEVHFHQTIKQENNQKINP